MSVFKERVNIGPVAKQLKQHGHASSAGAEIPTTGVIPDSAKAYAEYARIKPELYAVGAVIADYVVKQAYNQRNVAEMVESLTPDYPFQSLGTSIRDDIHASIASSVRKFEAGEGDTRLLSVYKRLKYLVRLEHRLVPKTRPLADVESFLQGGSSTAADVTSNMLNMVALHAYDFANPQRLIDIAQNSYPLIVKLAMSHGDAVLPVIGAFRGLDLPFLPFESDYFEIQGSGNRERLAISEIGRRIIQEITEGEDLEDFRSHETPTVGCLAGVNLGEGSAVRVVWDWHMEAARLIYPKLRLGGAGHS